MLGDESNKHGLRPFTTAAANESYGVGKVISP